MFFNQVSIGHRVAPPILPCVGDEMEIYVSQVFDPEHFWFVIQTPNKTKAFYSLMNDVKYV